MKRERQTATIDKNTLQELTDGQPEDMEIDERGQVWFVIANEILDTSRWSVNYHLVIRQAESTDLFGFRYEKPAGESNNDFWGEFDNEIKVLQVFPKQVVTTVYE